MNPYLAYNRQKLESLGEKERHEQLELLEVLLSERLSPIKDREKYFVEVEHIIADLRLAEHDLWSHDYDGDNIEIWGWNYMGLSEAGNLKITFTWNGKITIDWREE